MFLDSILALLETDNAERAKEVIRNGIRRIDNDAATSTQDNQDNKD